jgi:hypothetical protein
MAQFNASHECTKCELDLFYVPPTNTSIESSEYIEIEPLSKPDEHGPIEFTIEGNEKNYLDLNKTLLYLNVSILDQSGAAIKDSSPIGPVNNFADSLFQQIDVSLSNDSIETSNRTYAYRAYLENLLNFTNGAKNTHLVPALFIKDDFDNMDLADFKPEKIDSSNAVSKPNEGLLSRRNVVTKSGSSVELLTKLHSDIFNTERFMLNNVTIRIKLSRSSNEFALIYTSTSARIIINHAKLIVRKVVISPSVMTAHMLTLEKHTAKYPLKRVVVNNYAIEKDSNDYLSPKINAAILPTRVILGLVDSKAFSGNPKMNPYNFQNYDISSISLVVDSKNVPFNTALSFDYKKNQFSRGYYSLFDGVNGLTSILGQGISREEFANGYALYAFNIAPDLSINDNFNLIKQGVLKVNITFRTSTENSIKLITYCEYDNLIEINKSRNIVKDYTL